MNWEELNYSVISLDYSYQPVALDRQTQKLSGFNFLGELANALLSPLIMYTRPCFFFFCLSALLQHFNLVLIHEYFSVSTKIQTVSHPTVFDLLL